ncbi:MAG: hypothetical protein AAFO62_12775, partial [Pseudomonadota bacterium]
MSYSWVRRIETAGAWSELPVTVTLRAGALAGLGYLFVSVVLGVFVLVPTGLALGSVFALIPTADASALATAPAQMMPVSVAGVTAAFGLSLVGFAAAVFCALRSLAMRTEIEIGPRMVAMHQITPFGRRTSRAPVTAFEGLCVLPQTSLDGRVFAVYLLHPERDRSPLLMRSAVIDRDWIASVSAALNQPIVGALPAKDTGAMAANGRDRAHW